MKSELTLKQALRLMKKAEAISDYETAHSNADDILVAFLRRLGYLELIESYRHVGKWYS
jgi:hypothetical protein